MRFRGIKTSGYKRLGSFCKRLKAERAALPVDFEGMIAAASSYATQMDRLGLPEDDPFWQMLFDFGEASDLGDLQIMYNGLKGLSSRATEIMQNLDKVVDPSKLAQIRHALSLIADRAPLPEDFEGMLAAAENYAKQMKQMGLPRHDSFWDSYADFSQASNTEDLAFMQISLDSMAKRVPEIMQDLEYHTEKTPSPKDLEQGKESPDVWTSADPWTVSGLDFNTMSESVEQAISQWEEEVAPREVDPYSIFWDDVAAFREAVEFNNYDAALELYNKIVEFKDNYSEAVVPKEEKSEAELMDLTKLVEGKVAIPVRHRGPNRRKDRVLDLLEKTIGKPVKNLYDEEGDIGDEGEAWFDQDLDLGKGPSKNMDEVFDVEVEDSPEEEEEFVPETRKVDPFEF